MTTPMLPSWWPPSGYEELTEAQVRELFAYLKTVMPTAMEDAKRRIRERVGDDPIQVWSTTVKQLTGRQLDYLDALSVVHLSAVSANPRRDREHGDRDLAERATGNTGRHAGT